MQYSLFFVLFSFLFLSAPVIQGNTVTPALQDKDSVITLDICISFALQNNHKANISKESIKIADSQLRQAQSALYPSVSFSANASIMDDDLMFIMPGQEYFFDIPHIPGIEFNKVKTAPSNSIIMDNKNVHAKLKVEYPLYTGGKIQAVNIQAKNNADIARYINVKTDREIIFEVKQYYYSYILAKMTLDLLNETIERLDATLNLTESIYKNGSGKVTKLDYTKNRVLVDQVKYLQPELENNYNKSREALQFASGMSLPFNFSAEAFDIPFISVNAGYDEALQLVYKNNTDWSQINSAVEIIKAKNIEARSSMFPSVGIYAGMDANFNSFNYGLVNNYNKYIWTLGVGIRYDIFSGFNTSAQIEESEAGLRKINEEKILAKDALELQLKNIYHDLSSERDNITRLSGAKNNAEENCSLTERSFSQEMANAVDVVQAQIMSSLVQAQYLKALFEYAVSRARLELITGTEIK